MHHWMPEDGIRWARDVCVLHEWDVRGRRNLRYQVE